MNNIKFISYTGKFPNLCGGVLTLEIEGKEYKFGYENECDFPSFWSSGGECFFESDWEEIVTEGSWFIDVEELPKQFKEYVEQIDEVFNENVPYGCCGGCI